MTARIDFHSHLMPGVDDGARTVAQSLESLTAFAAQGFSTCLTTPHFDASLTRDPTRMAARLAQFDTAWETLTKATSAASGLPALARGVELMLDDPDPDLSDPRVRLAGGSFVLCEFPSLLLPTNAVWGIQSLVRAGWKPIVAHPERYRNLDPGLKVLGPLRDAGAHLQVNAGSVLGEHGEAAERAAQRLFSLGWVDYMASDHHARGAPATHRAVAVLEERGGEVQAKRLVEENPARMLAGELPLAVEAIEMPAATWLERFRRRSGL